MSPTCKPRTLAHTHNLCMTCINSRTDNTRTHAHTRAHTCAHTHTHMYSCTKCRRKQTRLIQAFHTSPKHFSLKDCNRVSYRFVFLNLHIALAVETTQ